MNTEYGRVGLDHQPLAPWLPIPARAISVIEHPCIIKNIDKGIISLGGPARLSKGLLSKLEPASNESDELKSLISVSLRPDDPFAKRLLSSAVTTNNVLLRVTVPRRTGRKRKRGSSGPFLSEDDIKASGGTSNGSHTRSVTNYVDAPTIFKSLQDNPSSYRVAIAGLVDETHRFRAMPDLQYAAARDDTMVKIRDHLLPMRHSELKKYKLSTAPGPDLTQSVGPSAEFLQTPIAFNYRFEQNIYVKYTKEGVVNLQKRLTYTAYIIVKPTVETVPTGPNSSLPAESTLTPYMQTMIAQIRAELNKRPIMTRHLLYNKLGWDKRDRLRQAAIYCGYFFESGPWREAIVKWGVDPRQDPKYRKYQTVSFLSYLNTGTPRHYRASDDHIQKLAQMPLQELETQHIFNGKSVSQTGNLYQFCDITDPLIAKILATEDIRTTCAPTYQGWYHVGTWAKATVILKDKMNTIISKGTLDDAVYARITAWPELWDDKEVAATYKAEIDDRQIHQEKMKEHTIMHTVRWAARNPRYAFEKMGALDSQQGQAGETEEVADDEEVPEDMTEIPDTAAAILNEGDKDDEDQEDYNEGEGNEEEDILDDALIPEEAAEDEDDDDCEVPMMAKRLASEGPAPFGGLYAI